MLFLNDCQNPGKVLAVTRQDGISRNVDASAGMATNGLEIAILADLKIVKFCQNFGNLSNYVHGNANNLHRPPREDYPLSRRGVLG